jgi:hypothetical protein
VSAGSGFGFVEESCFCAKVKAVEHQDRQPPSGFRLQDLARGAFPRACFRIEWNHSIEKESRKIKELERWRKSCHFFKTAALRCHRSRGRSFRPGA